ncbi:unnamed protein product [Medioppia subpectinata]|uniref:NADH:flavin oxidoreductase/NADH oxidase N-terminal domain-containing protein n=1 Tax=Medioppia subpectinata TaxID=1979941 RepID=A0A7R9KTW4_9ACAR|nr:unnamed protein product [Medioppia subpectinata]CAG2109729.1 unnamed protein product [Medioppia subpectinata]
MLSGVQSLLFTPLTIRSVTFRNRIAVSPMSQFGATDNGVAANDWDLVTAGAYAKGGAGLVMVGGVTVCRAGRHNPHALGLWCDEQRPELARVARFVAKQGAVPGVQLLHAGRKCKEAIVADGRAAGDDGHEFIAASAIPFAADYMCPLEASVEDIEAVCRAHVEAAVRAVDIGFKVIELHFAHGYLVHTFLSALTNSRTDLYGGSLDNRMRFALSIACAVRQAIGDHIVLAVRVSVTDYCPDGWDVKQTVVLAKRLKALGVDLIDCSSGGLVSGAGNSSMNPTAIQIESAGIIQREAGVATAAHGLIVDPHQAEHVLTRTGAALVIMGRALINNPNWPYMAADALGVEGPAVNGMFKVAAGKPWGTRSHWRKQVADLQQQ